MHTLIASVLMAIGLLGPAGQPFERTPGETVVIKPDGAIVYEWPPVRTAYLIFAPLGEIDAWMKHESWRGSSLLQQGRHDLSGLCPLPSTGVCVCMNGYMSPYPVDSMLTPGQWAILFDRIGREATRTNDLASLRSMLDRMLVSHTPDQPAGMPDLTPLLLAVVDAAARGHDSLLVQAGNAHRLSAVTPGIYDQKLVRARLVDAAGSTTNREHAFALAQLAIALGLRDELPMIFPERINWAP